MIKEDPCLLSVATFSKLAGRYADKYFDLRAYDAHLKQFLRLIPAGSPRVLDLACGPGNVAAFLSMARPGLKIVGIDLAEGMIAQAKRRVPQAEFFVQDCRHVDLPGRVFDACTFAFGLSYLTDADVVRCFRSLNAVMTNNAVLYLATITGEPGDSGIETSASGDQVHQVYRRIDDVVSLVRSAGYRIEATAQIPSPATAPKATQDLILIAQRT